MLGSWLSAEEAQQRLKVKPQTLYAYVSRGLIAARTDLDAPRRHLYAAADIERLALRSQQGRGVVARETASASAPILASGLSTISEGRLYYCGRDVIALAERATLEDCARLLWKSDEVDPFGGLGPSLRLSSGPDARTRAYMLLAQRAAEDPTTAGRPAISLLNDSASLMMDLADAVGGAKKSGPLHRRLASAWRVEGDRVDLIRICLVLSADHDIAAPSYAARVVASTGAPLSACVLAALAAQSGPKPNGGVAQAAGFLAECARDPDPKGAVRRRFNQSAAIPGFGHPLYPLGDPRARFILERLPPTKDVQDIAASGEEACGLAPNLDFALAAAARTLKLPMETAFSLFVLGRSVGWVAHTLEQNAQNRPIEPRTHYIGPPPRLYPPQAKAEG